MKNPDDICLTCDHFRPNNTDESIDMGCRAYPQGIPYLYPPNNEHKTKLDGQNGDFVFTPAKKIDARYLAITEG